MAVWKSLLSWQRISSGDHRCIALLYNIPLWNFDCVLSFGAALKMIYKILYVVLPADKIMMTP